MTTILPHPELYTLRLLVGNARRLQAENEAAQEALRDYSKRIEAQYSEDGRDCVVDISTGEVTLNPKLGDTTGN